MISENSRHHFSCDRLGLCITLTLLMLLSAAVKPAYAQVTFFDGLGSFDAVNGLWNKSDWANDVNVFDVGWRPNKVRFNLEPGKMILQLDDHSCPVDCHDRPYGSGEIQSKASYGYGKFATRMKTVSGSGLVTSFFTYSGSGYGQSDHDEIDIEILGKDPWTMEIHYYANGFNRLVEKIPLGFDSSLDYHNYGFVWTADKIEWWVDGSLVHTMQATDLDLDGDIDAEDMPNMPSKIMANMWVAPYDSDTDKNWLGHFTYPGTPVRAGYDWIKYEEIP